MTSAAATEPSFDLDPTLPPSDYDILIVEDTASMRTIYEAHMRRAGYRTLATGTAGEALELFRAHRVSVVLLDLMLPDRDGLDLLIDLLDVRPSTSVVVVAAERSTERTVSAIRRGALDYLVKPVSETRLMEAVEAAQRAANLAHPPHSKQARTPVGDFVGHSAPMLEVYETIRACARSMAPVCIIGENGTGKEMAAQAIHRLSDRAQGPFITLDCGALTSDRFETEVFGHRRGAFAGAVNDRLGAAELADGGTLFLDEICDLPLALQTKLLRFLQTGQVHPLGAEAARRVNLRILAATSIAPEEAMRRGQLRSDLYYRLMVVPLRMPPLCNRPEDIPLLADTFLHRFSALEGRGLNTIAPETMARLKAHNWPGNVRELANVVRAATVLHEGDMVLPDMLPKALQDIPSAAPVTENRPDFESMTLAELERAAIEAALGRHDGAVQRAAADLGVAPSTLYRKLDTWRQD
ncbi:two component Fis family sigma54 specific transcriptional regulator [Rhodobacter aestuarii]|uniref:Nif-specific regulatory protein n=1 Tax=Rhodobacter aestuarii TaxID=453582 RepID=A0A1N7NB75_9RHOB|nr:sigma-54 dependent transcriptional regulator [Rhodobacter aestuarii]PTV96354.1 two component Fis family sigma54 specific transcriptional regulator [Rhodobacter aestuarii]SIS95562.1 two component, sigma54 specific, transcriptional regulator, Fis family [Rhodobacter aestuarii]